MYIHSLNIENFQNHKKTYIEFNKGFNVMIGSSDSGKSSILKAILWVITNKPSGNSFIKWKEDFSKVTITMSDKTVINRYKSEKENYYSLNEAQFKAIGQNVPQEILDIFNITDINIQKQADAHFLIGDKSSGEIATYLNNLVDLNLIDIGIFNLNNKQKENIKEQKILEEQYNKYNTEIINLPDTKNLEKNIEDIEISFENYSDKKENIQKLIKYKEKLEEYKNNLIECKELLFINKYIKEIDKINEKTKDNETIINFLNTTKEQLKTFLNKMEEYDKIIKLKEDIDKIIELNTYIKNKKIKIEQLVTCKEYLELSTQKINQYNKELIEYDKKIKSFKICPICNRRM